MKLNKWLIITTSYSTIGALGIYAALFQFTLLNFTQLYGLNSVMMGLFIAIQYSAIAFPPLFLGLLSAKIGKKKVLMISYLFVILGTLLVGSQNSLLSFMIAIFIIGAGFSVLEATHSATLADEFPGESKRHINFSQVCFSIGALSSPFLAEFLMKSGIYFRDLYLLLSIIFFIIAILFLFVKFRNGIKDQKSNKSIFKILSSLKNKTFFLLAIAIFLYVGIENTIASFTGNYFELILKTPQFSGFALSLFWGAMIPSRLIAGILKTNARKMFLFSCLLVFTSIIGAMLIPNNTIKIVLFAVCGFGCGPIWPFIMTTTADKFNGSSAPPLNILMSFCGMGGAVIPLLSGIMISHANGTVAYYFSAVLLILMLFIYYSSEKARRVVSS